MKINNKSISIAFVIILAATVIISLAGMLLMNRQPLVLQGQVEATEIRISGKLPGRVDSFLVQEGDWVKAGDTLVVINSPTIEAKYRQVNALEQVAQEQNKKIDAGTRRQIVATARQLWNKTQSDLALAKTTYQRIVTLYKDSVVTSQRRDEVEAMYKAAQAAERAAYEQYQMAVDGAQSEDRASARSLVEAARSTVDEVSSLLVDSRLTAPENGQIATIFPKRGELVAPGTPIMSLVVMDDAHVVLNIREDLMPQFKMGGTFRADVPAIDGKDIGGGVQVRIARRRGADAHGLIGQVGVQRLAVCRGVHRDRLDAHGAACADDAHGNLATVRNEDLVEHGARLALRVRAGGDAEQRLVVLHLRAVCGQHLGDDARCGGGDLVHHLHGLHDGQRLAGQHFLEIGRAHV